MGADNCCRKDDGHCLNKDCHERGCRDNDCDLTCHDDCHESCFVPKPCPPHPKGKAVLEFQDPCPIPLCVFIKLFQNIMEKCPLDDCSVEFGWCQGQRAIAITAKELMAIVEGKFGLFTLGVLFSILNGHLFCKRQK